MLKMSHFNAVSDMLYCTSIIYILSLSLSLSLSLYLSISLHSLFLSSLLLCVHILTSAYSFMLYPLLEYDMFSSKSYTITTDSCAANDIVDDLTTG